MEEEKAPRNGFVDLARLGFAGVVMMYHFYSGEKHFPGGYMGVEFFMILAGFLMFSAWDRNHVSTLPIKERQHYWLDYMKKRYVRFFSYCLIAFVLAFFVARVWLGKLNGITYICDILSEDIWEILLVKFLGFNRGAHLLNVPAWTLNCMLFAEFFVLGMLTFWKRQFFTFLMPLSVIFGAGYWMNVEDIAIKTVHIFFTFGMLHVYLLTCIGIFAYGICKKLKEISFSKAGRYTLTAAELMGYGICVLITLYRPFRYYRACFILIATFVLAISFSGKSFAGSMLPANTFTNFCAELSMSLYLTHYPVLVVFRHLFRDANDLYRQKFIFLCYALAVALAYTYIMRGVFKVLPIMKKKMKSVMLERP